jgi:RecJ-like exonuclease
MTQLKKPDYPIGCVVETEVASLKIESTPCIACKGKTVIKLDDEVSYKCPRCKGSGKDTTSTRCKKIIQMTVRTITMIINKHGQQISYECINEGRLTIYGENELRKAV